MKNTVIVVLLGIVAGLGFLYVRETHRVERWRGVAMVRSNEVTTIRQTMYEVQRRAERDTSRAAAREAEVQALRAEAAAAQAAAPAAATSAPARTAAAAAPAPSPAPAADEQPGESFMRSLSKMMESPEMKQLLEEQMRAQFAPVYQGLLDRLALPPEEREAFTQLLTERIMTQIGPAIALQQGGLDAEQTAALKDEMKTERDKVNAMIKDMLGDDGYATYQEYERTEQERIVVTQFAREASASGAPLDAAASDNLVRIMSEERAAAARDAQYMKPESLMPDDLTETTVERLLRQERGIAERVASRASTCLTPAQLSAFDEFQARQARMREMQLRMAVRMFRSKAPAR